VFKGKKVVVVMPAYNAAKTLVRTYDEVMAQEVVDLVLVVDDASRDETAAIARSLPRAKVHVHDRNRGYGANQRTCYRLALLEGADIVVMVHPDYQYTPQILPSIVALIGNGVYPCVFGSRILGGGARRGGMPLWRYVANRALTLYSNVVLGAKLSEYHSGYRGYSREILSRLPLEENSDDFVFDNEMLAEVLWLGYEIGEVSCPTRYFAEASSINFRRSVRYGLGCVTTGLSYRLARWGLLRSAKFPRPV
jgi:glycosyltransferase involved in cell wall biosynthesis